MLRPDFVHFQIQTVSGRARIVAFNFNIMQQICLLNSLNFWDAFPLKNRRDYLSTLFFKHFAMEKALFDVLCCGFGVAVFVIGLYW
jgi:hypothetical protein